MTPEGYHMFSRGIQMQYETSPLDVTEFDTLNH